MLLNSLHKLEEVVIDSKARIALLLKVFDIPDDIKQMAKSIKLTEQTPIISLLEADQLPDGSTCTVEGQIVEVSSH